MRCPDAHDIAFEPSPSPAVVGYVLKVGTEPGVYSQTVDVGAPTVGQTVVYHARLDRAVDLYAALSA